MTLPAYGGVAGRRCSSRSCRSAAAPRTARTATAPALADEQQTLTDLADSAAEGGVDVLTPTLESFERLRAAAPEELQDEWDTVVRRLPGARRRGSGRGVDPADYRPDEPPPGLSQAELGPAGRAWPSKLASARVGEAVAGIEHHAAEVCDVDFAG